MTNHLVVFHVQRLEILWTIIVKTVIRAFGS